MKRRKFFEYLGLGAMVAVVPKVVESMPVEKNNGEVLIDWVKENFEKGSGKLYAPEEVGMRPHVVKVTKSPLSTYAGYSTEIGLSGDLHTGSGLMIPQKHTNAKRVTMWRIMEKKSDGIYVIAPYEMDMKIHGIAVGTKLVLGGSSSPK